MYFLNVQLHTNLNNTHIYNCLQLLFNNVQIVCIHTKGEINKGGRDTS